LDIVINIPRSAKPEVKPVERPYVSIKQEFSSKRKLRITVDIIAIYLKYREKQPWKQFTS
jgi:hypothetical protein